MEALDFSFSIYVQNMSVPVHLCAWIKQVVWLPP